MSLNSVEYFLLTALTAGVTFLLPARFRWLLWLAASLLFYLSFGEPLLLLALGLASTISYSFGLAIPHCRERMRPWLLGTGITLLAGILIIYRYLPFLAGTLRQLSAWSGAGLSIPEAPVLASIGVSFYTFQAIAYLVSIHFEIAPPEKNPGLMVLHFAFFPKLLQGPIERPEALLPQLRQPSRLTPENLRLGMLMMASGLFKKTILADRLGLYADAAFNNPGNCSGLMLWLATYIYAFQLYFDFTGYMDLARGSARILGIELVPNFDLPYRATSIADFWRRWHTSFSHWILDYIFKPLQMKWRNLLGAGSVLALLVTFLVSGLWHGPSWNFILWGLLHGIFLGAAVIYRPWQKKWHAMLRIKKGLILSFFQMLATFHLVCLGWILFRTSTPAEAWYVCSHLFSGSQGTAGFLLSRGVQPLAVAAGASILLLLIHLFRHRLQGWRWLLQKPWYLRWLFYYVFLLVLLSFGMENQPGFLYFKF